MEIIKHSLHKHELSLSQKKREAKIICDACNEDCDEGVMIYSCRKCDFDLHESCAKLPQELHNPLLHPHPLSLVRPQYRWSDNKCNACLNICRGIIFRCDECDFDLDVACALIRPAAIEEGEEGTHHFSHHEHPLLLLQNIPARRIRCRVCGEWYSDLKAYGCLPCGFFLHRFCLNLPQEIFHPFHPYHPLTLKCFKDPLTLKCFKDPLTLKPIKDCVKCNACRNRILGCLAYFCEHCNNTKTSFHLHIECANVIMPAITYEGHDHLLLFVGSSVDIKKLRDELIKYCSVCKSTCKSSCESYGFRCVDLHFNDTRGTDELIKYCSACKSTICKESYGFRCLDLDCDFNLHLTCGPLPYSIQHKSHIHPLILTNCPIEDEMDCEPDGFFCYACEEERDPFLPIYYCNECPFVAGISCVISEVVSLLKGEHGDVELRNIPFGQFGKLIREKQQLVINPALTLYDILKSAEIKELRNALMARGWETITTGDWKFTEIIFKGGEAYTQFMKFVDIGIEIPIEFRDTNEDVRILNFKFCFKLLPEEEVVDIEDYKITRKLAPILKDLLSKYGDVSAESKLSPRAKVYFFHMLCECIYSMINTKVVDITTNDLLNWWTCLEISKRVGFRIQFASDHLKRVAHAHFGLFAEKQGSEALARLDRDIEALKEKRELIASIQSNLIEKCSRETSMRKGWKAGVGLLDFCYRCDKCLFDLDVKCTFIRPAAIEEGEEEAEAVVVGTHHFSHHHQHPLLLLEKIPTDSICCRVCGGWRSDPKTYGCRPCRFFLHPSCLNDLPEEIFHPFHPYHSPLTLKRIKDDDDDDDDDDDVKCNACRNDIYGDFAYFCEHCNNAKTSFCLHAECASVIMPAITYQAHDHLLLFGDNMKNIGDESAESDDSDEELIKHCSACKSTICEESYAFRCLDLDCDFSLHLTCGPLPYTIQHKSHIHPLILTNCPIEDEKDCKPNEFFCYACEEERDPFLPIYYCNECPFVAEISCVISEVVSFLKGEHGDVELRNPFGQFGKLIREKQEQRMIKPALTLSDIFNSLSEAEKNELDHAFQWIRLFDGSAMGLETITSKDWKCKDIVFNRNEAYTQFMKFVHIGIEIPIEFLDTKKVWLSNFWFCYRLLPKEEVIDIENYKITRKLAPILKDLLSKYGDVSAKSKLSSKVKLYLLLMLCECIYSMIHTKVMDITTKDLLNWWTILETSKCAGFRIQFAFDHLKRVALAHFGLFAEKQGSKVLDQLATDIEALKGKLKRLTLIKSCLIEKNSRETSMRKGWKAGVGLL